ncbi:tRNA (adenosine(37)-N6)-dimethylallyltransferase MiaA [Candidatus Woesebacteria bacterium RIFCSPLOWO2_01_FULL_37_19]|uniref:tRNA dimethylallyltransferase n=2 Tax=Candidatus Woeseibacteriota TaxID=1752722 RepID=A0A1F8B5Y3_9BACT|nr:MAG: tRNA (adenosine(37)-N6)-dimethylallyltransferase MiaA [Candidatus Woesebacteria bacterium RIFCSPHIGHO2_01_FULL_38_26b]OGM59417.1 MAG: tRNA (adenosine(37)-N6)-dimethylallyltransferase MiaA [Candidatus Woesebacteria bacterium RIFCSPLOWO2_01_FULL_37_19]
MSKRSVNLRQKLLVICGPTATGKTSLALHLAKLFNGELVSADSRQVYKGMDIGTGKDLPVNSKIKDQKSKLGNEEIGFYEINGIRIWGYDLVKPAEEFSVAQYVSVTYNIIKNIYRVGKLPILVGGTGLYIKGVIDGIPTAFVPKNENLRKFYVDKKVDELFEILSVVDPIKAASMNVSDRKNPRRLIRAIEVAQYELTASPNSTITSMAKAEEEGGYKYDTLFIGLKADKNAIKQKIKERVNQRIKFGLEKEIKNLIERGISWNDQSMNALGYIEWKDYFSGEENIQEVITEWNKDENNYVKRQITWFKKEKRVNWFDISNKDYIKEVEKMVKEWHNDKNQI